jgi:fibronectin-binding autotransporter adhesin
MRRILSKSPAPPGIAESLYRASIGAIFAAAIGVASALASDFDVNVTADSGVGSIRDGLSQAQSGDRLVFQPVLNNTILTGSPLTVGTAVTFTDSNLASVPLNLTDNHAYTLAPSLTTYVTNGKTTTAVQTPVPLTVNWAGTLTLNGILSDPATTPGSLAKSGVGTLVLTNANTFNGGVTISGGTLLISNSSALGVGALTASAPTGSTATLDFGKSLNLANTITLTSALTVNSAAGLTNQLSGVISGAGATGGLTTTGTGTLILSGANTFTGGVHAGDGSTISLLNNTGLGTGTLTNTGLFTLNLGDGIVAKNAISLAKPFTANVDSGTATLSGAITDTPSTASNSLKKTGAGTLILTGVNSYKGGTTISQGTLQGNSSGLQGNITNNASLIFNQTGGGTYAGNITGTGDMTKTGFGTLLFSGTSMLPTTMNLNAGVLQVTGSLTSPVNVENSTATLSGSGSVGSITNNGVVKPGAASLIGDLTVNGDYTQQAGGSTQIRINSLGQAPGINNDELIINGQAKLAGALKVLTLDPTYTPGTRYTILTDMGGVTGTFSLASTNNYRYGAEIIYGTNNVQFELKPTTSLYAGANTQNQASVGTALDGIVLSNSGTSFASGPLFSLINNLGIQPVDQQRQAMNQLSGSLFGNIQTVGLQVGNQFQQLVTNTLVGNGMFLAGGEPSSSSGQDVRGQSPTGEITRGWVQGFGVSGNLRSDGNAGGVNYGQGGAVFGIDGGRDETGVVGLAVGSSYVQVHDSIDANSQITSYQIGAYALKHDDEKYSLGSLTAGYNSYFTQRNISIPGSEQVLHANYSGSQIGANAEAGLKLAAGPFLIQPLIGMQYLYLCQQGFEEYGGSAALNGNRSRANSLRANIGARVLLDPWEGWNGAIWTPYTHARFISELLDNDRILNASFAGAPTGGAFTSQGTRIGYNYGVFGEGLEVRINDSWSLLGNADVMVGERMTITTGSITSVTRW